MLYSMLIFWCVVISSILCFLVWICWIRKFLLFSVVILLLNVVISVEDCGVFSIRVWLVLIVVCIGGVVFSNLGRLCVSLLWVVCCIGVLFGVIILVSCCW